VPIPSYPPELPISARRDALVEAIRRHRVVVVCGDTGSGKSTQLPKLCLEAGRGVRGAIAHTQPRRIAARSVAARIAEELAVPLGSLVGVKTRFDDRTGPNTLISVMTDGLLLAEARRDRDLLAYDTIIVDEAHERSLTIDFLLGCLRRLLERRRDLTLVITSATIDPDRFSRHFGGAPIVLVEGRTYPIETRHRPIGGDLPEGERDEDDPDVLAAILAAIDEIDASPRDAERGRLRDVLVFLSGEREIRETAEALKGRPNAGEILPLYARLSAEEQDRVFRPSQRRRIVLATNVAETSITVPGIDAVIDPGLARISRYSPRGRVQRLPIEPIAQASADQRRGRCGRTGPGLCIRLYSEEDYAARPRFTPPEILRTNLASVILQMASLRLGEPEEFPFLDPPPARLVAAGYDTLVELGAMTRRRELTPLGRRMAELPVDPRLARMLLASIEERCVEEVLVIVAVLSVQDPRERLGSGSGDERADAAALAQLRFRDERSDFLGFLALWKAWRERSSELGSSALRRWCREHALSWLRMREWTDVHRQLRDVLRERIMPTLPGECPPETGVADPNAVHRALLAGLVANLGKLGDDGEYRGPNGGQFRIHPSSVLAKRSPPWVIAAEIVETSRRFARICARIQSDWVERVAPHLCQRATSEPHWLRDAQQVAAWERVSLGALTVVPRRRVPFGPIDPKAARDIFIQSALVDGELRTKGSFLERNARLREELALRGAKSRHAVPLVEAERLHAFYDERLPADIHSGPSFESWRRRAERSQPDLLVMRPSDLLRHDAPTVDDAAFPDEIGCGAVTLPLAYRHAPGEADDGVTVRVPLAAVGALDLDRLEWLVPGLLVEKLTALLRSLPKRLRVRFQPAADFAAGAAEEMPFGVGPLRAAFARHLRALTGVAIEPSDFDLAALPPHLAARIEIVGDDGRVLGAGRDAERLVARFRGAATTDLRRLVAEDPRSRAWMREGLRDFEIEELPETLGIDVAGRVVVVHPAFEEVGRGGGASASVVVLESAAAARAAHRRGVRRLLAIRLRSALEHHLEYLPAFEEMALAFAPLGDRETLVDQLVLLAVEFAALEPLARRGEPIPRSAVDFARLVREAESGCFAAARDAGELAARILLGRQETAILLDAPSPAAWAPAIASMRSDLARLVDRDVLATRPLALLRETPRHLAAIRSRLRRLPNGLERDALAAEEIAAWRGRLARLPATTPEEVRARLELLVEEYQVQRFAGELRTVVPVSAERLEVAFADASEAALGVRSSAPSAPRASA
jgi:ATP-dependent helicase HrpA